MSNPEAALPPQKSWTFAKPEEDARPSLPEVNASIAVPSGGVWFRRLLAFMGPGYMVSVGYMDPGNWATDIAGGSQFGYLLLSVILLSNLMAILLQALAARLGIVTGMDRLGFARSIGGTASPTCSPSHKGSSRSRGR